MSAWKEQVACIKREIAPAQGVYLR